ncbi:MAG: hypothetical protein IIC89_06620, partial [Chloroflexi bacterium]|nr:hypothetical protein [Chloroflexota bacterium]
MSLTGVSVTGNVIITESPIETSMGQIRSLQASPMYPASSFFDIYLIVVIPFSPISRPVILHNEQPLHLEAVGNIDAWPPIGATFAGEPNPPNGGGAEPQTYPPGQPHCTSGLQLLPSLPAKICLDSVSLVVEGSTVPTPTDTPTVTPTFCPAEVCTPTPTITPGPSPTATRTPFTFPTATFTPSPLPLPEEPSFSAAAGSPSGIHPADVLSISGAPVVVDGNDDFDDALIISSLPFTGTQNTAGATLEAGEETNPNGCITFEPDEMRATVWYRYTPPVGTFITANTFIGSGGFDTVLAVYTGDAVDALTPVVCNDDSGNLQSQVQFLATGGTTYHFQIGGFDSRTGNLRLTLTAGAAGGAGLPQFTTFACEALGLGADGCDDGSDGDQDDLDALSDGSDFGLGDDPIAFSVGPGSVGLPGTDVAAQAACTPAEPQADEFTTPLDGTNASVFDGDGLGANCPTTHSFGLTEVPTSDDLDALTDQSVATMDSNGDGAPDSALFFSLAAGSPTLAERGRDPADVLWTSGGFQPGLYASASTLGLQPGDDIDALCLSDVGAASPAYNPELDVILFSLAPGSPTLAALSASAADVLGPGPVVVNSAAELGLQASDDLNAMKCFSGPTPTPTATPTGIVGDANCNGTVDSVDSLIVLQFSAGLFPALN